MVVTPVWVYLWLQEQRNLNVIPASDGAQPCLIIAELV